MRPASSAPRSARINSASRPSSVSRSSGRLVRMAASEEPSDGRGAPEPAAQALPPAAALFIVRHGAARDSRFGMTPEEMLARLLYRDGLMLVIDKPAGFAVHRGPKGGEALDDAFRRAALRPAARRLRWRTGSTRTPPAAWCSAATARRWRCSASCSSRARSARPIGRWSKAGRRRTKAASILRSSKRDEARGWWMKPDPHGLPSATTWKVMGRGDGLTWLALEPLTGRTHQLRVHCAEMGWPIVGDTIYGGAPRAGRPAAASARARGDGADFQEQAAGEGRSAGAGAHARAAGEVRMERRSSVKHRLDGAPAASRSYVSPPSLPWLNSAMMVPVDGRLLRSILVASSHSFERTIAFEQWK